jgi:predicted transcriptional regulator
MELQEIQQAVNESGFSVMDCVRKTGLHPQTIYRIKQGKAKKLNPLTQNALTKYFKKVAAK